MAREAVGDTDGVVSVMVPMAPEDKAVAVAAAVEELEDMVTNIQKQKQSLHVSSFILLL